MSNIGSIQSAVMMTVEEISDLTGIGAPSMRGLSFPTFLRILYMD